MSSAENGKLVHIWPAVIEQLRRIAGTHDIDTDLRLAADEIVAAYDAAPADPAEAILAHDPYPEDQEGARSWANRVLHALGVPEKETK